MPLKIPYYEMDIPRLVTALADWLACLLYLRFLPPRYGGVKRAALYGGALAALALYLVATDGFDGWRFNVLYAVSVALMLLFMAAATRADRWQVGYFCTRAFILAGFAGALTWQMYVYFARYIAALQSLPALVLFIAAGFGIIFGLMWLLEDGGSTGSIQFDIRPRTTCIAAVMAAAISTSMAMWFHTGLAIWRLSERRETRYRMQSPVPYSGTYGPTIKPGLIHLLSGLLPEIKRRKKSSSTQPSEEPI